jgi:hypothetical protein
MVPAKNKKNVHWYGFWHLEQIVQGPRQSAILMATYKMGS